MRFFDCDFSLTKGRFLFSVDLIMIFTNSPVDMFFLLFLQNGRKCSNFDASFGYKLIPCVLTL